jgi:hypothetical protein
MYRIETTYQNRITGEIRKRVLPRPYKTMKAAQKAADAMCYVTKQDGVTETSRLNARVIVGD